MSFGNHVPLLLSAFPPVGTFHPADVRTTAVRAAKAIPRGAIKRNFLRILAEFAPFYRLDALAAGTASGVACVMFGVTSASVRPVTQSSAPVVSARNSGFCQTSSRCPNDV